MLVRNKAQCALLLLLLGCLLLSSCPPRGGKGTGSGGAADGGKADPASLYPPEALSYLKESLTAPADGEHPALARCWEVIARLRHLEADTAIRAEVQRRAIEMHDKPPYQLLAAWLRVDPQAARAELERRLKDSELSALAVLSYRPELAPEMLAVLDLSQVDAQLGHALLSIMRDWRGKGSLSDASLQQLAANPNQELGLQAIGHLMARGLASPAQLEQLKNGLRSEDARILAAAVEGARFSGDAALADDLVPLVANTKMGEAPPASGERDYRAIYGSYALAWLPGEQAEMMRLKLLNAAEPLVRWQARLGEAQAGNSIPWLEALKARGADDPDMWLALEPPEAMAPDLLITYEMAAQSADRELRGRSARQLARYAAAPEREKLNQVLRKLVMDSDAEVAERAWLSAAEASPRDLADEAGRTLASIDASPDVRLAAAYYLLQRAELPDID